MLFKRAKREFKRRARGVRWQRSEERVVCWIVPPRIRRLAEGCVKVGRVGTNGGRGSDAKLLTDSL